MKFEKHVLKNGLRVLLAPMENTETATVLFLVGAGSKYETKKINGASHFLEHLAFKGTKKRPNPKDITAEIDAVGGQINAFTGEEYTGYYVKVNHQNLALALDVVSDISLNSLLPEKEIERERGVILEEINMYEDLPMHKVSDIWIKVMHGDQPAGRTILGEKDVIKNISRKEIFDYRNAHYKAENSLVVMSGNFSQLKNVLTELEKLFGKMGDGRAKNKMAVKNRQQKPEFSLGFKETDQTHLLVGFRGVSLKQEAIKDRFVLSVIGGLLGGYMSSRLFQEIREKRGWAYYIHSFVDFDTDCGSIGAQAGVVNDKVCEAIKVILNEFKKIKNGQFSKKEVEIAKSNLVGGMALSLEGSSAIASFLGKQELLEGKILTPEQMFDKIKAVSANDIKRVAKKYFVNKGLNLALIGPHQDKKAFEKVLKI